MHDTQKAAVLRSLELFKKYDEYIGSALEVFDADSIVAASKSVGPLSGKTGFIKDNICQKNRALTCASRILEGYTAPYDATAVERLKSAGVLLMGRANMDEFAMGASTETSAFKKTKNPWDLTRVPGGSSGGSAAAVAAGFVDFALGTETGGSVRQPAAWCGVVGSKPTYGLVSRYGVVAYASSLDQIGIVTRTIQENAQVLSVIAGHDTNDATSLPEKKWDFTQELTGTLKPGLRIGVIQNALNNPGVDPEVRALLDAALQKYTELGAQLVPINLPTMDYSAAIYVIVSRAEAASNLARFDGIRYGLRVPNARSLSAVYDQSRYEGFGKEVKRRILIGNYVLSAGHAAQYYQSAKQVQALMRAEFMRAFEQVDLLFAPVSPSAAFKFGALDDNRLEMDLQDYFTSAANLTGIPAVSVPCGFTQQGLPIGFQLMGPDLSEARIFHAAYAYEQNTSWHTMRPS